MVEVAAAKFGPAIKRQSVGIQVRNRFANLNSPSLSLDAYAAIADHDRRERHAIGQFEIGIFGCVDFKRNGLIIQFRNYYRAMPRATTIYKIAENSVVLLRR